LEKQPAVAELRFTAQGVSLYGTVMEMSAEDIAVRLHAGPASRDLFLKDNVVEMIVVARNTMFMASTRVLGVKNGLLQLGFLAPVRTVQRRNALRVPIELDVSFRPIQDHGCFGLWKHGVSTDISSGGMCLLIPPGIEVPRKTETLFMLPNSEGEYELASVRCADDGIEMLKTFEEIRLEPLRIPTKDSPLKATARVSNRIPRAEGYIALGLTFTLLSPADQIRLARFLSARGC
jgi:hypothetical protein